MIDILCVASGYLLGSINPAYIISRLKGFDIRKKGTGNAGATNIGLELGIGYGVLALLFDILKAFIATFVPHKLLQRAVEVAALSGIACILGHIYPIFMEFKGGKGVACVIGFGFGIAPLLVLPVVVVSMALGWLVGASTFVPVFASILMSLYYASADSTQKGYCYASCGHKSSASENEMGFAAKNKGDAYVFNKR